jgi:hypothetical protein
MMAQVAGPGPQLHASYLGVDPVGPVEQLEQSNLAYGDPQASCLEQAAAENHIPAGKRWHTINIHLVQNTNKIKMLYAKERVYNITSDSTGASNRLSR